MEVGQGELVRGGDVVEEAVVAAGAVGAVGLGTMCSGLDQGAADRQMIPNLSSSAK